ncbi:MAG TPA: hypothetical protein VHS06_11145, partial [Chloroflexota bacterium]|nr:hypothetical protein [Chloroflexota bacterium]
MKSYRSCLLLAASLLAAGAACAAPRLLLFDSADGITERALQALQVPHTLASPDQYGSARVCLFDYRVAIWGMDADQSPLNADPGPAQSFVRIGGVFLAMRSQGDIAWAPRPLKQDKAYAVGQILKPDHPLLTTPHAFDAALLYKVHGGSIYRAFYALGEQWTPLVATGAEQSWDKTTPASPGPHYGLVEMKWGAGHIILCQMIPDYGLINDDKGQPGASRQFLDKPGVAALA